MQRNIGSTIQIHGRYLSQREAAEVLGLTAQGLSHELDFCFKQYLKHSHVFSDEDIRNLLGDVETPAEKLAKDVLQVGEDGRYLLVNKERRAET